MLKTFLWSFFFFWFYCFCWHNRTSVIVFKSVNSSLISLFLICSSYESDESLQNVWARIIVLRVFDYLLVIFGLTGGCLMSVLSFKREHFNKFQLPFGHFMIWCFILEFLCWTRFNCTVVNLMQCSYQPKMIPNLCRSSKVLILVFLDVKCSFPVCQL